MKSFHSLRLVLLSVVVGVSFLMPHYAGALESADSIAVRVDDRGERFFRPKQLILPLSLVAVGAFGVNNGAFRHLNRTVRDGMDDLRGNHYFHVDDYVQYLPIVTYLGLDFVGVSAKHSFKERLVAGTTAYMAMAVMVNATKYTAKEMRPDSSRRNSFPSGHTATVFTGAELMREEYGLGIGIASYTVATGVAFLRLYNGRHWLNDVVAGAGIGILSARIGYWMLPLYRKWFHWDASRTSAHLSILPAYTPDTRTLSCACLYLF